MEDLILMVSNPVLVVIIACFGFAIAQEVKKRRFRRAGFVLLVILLYLYGISTLM